MEQPAPPWHLGIVLLLVEVLALLRNEEDTEVRDDEDGVAFLDSDISRAQNSGNIKVLFRKDEKVATFGREM